MAPSKTADPEFDHEYVTVWQQGVAGGGVADAITTDHVVRCQGFVYDSHNDGEHTYVGEADAFGRLMRVTNAPVWLTLAFAKALLDRRGAMDTYDRMVAGETVTTAANFYTVEAP